MQLLLFESFKKNSEECFYFPCNYDIEVLSIYFSYGYLSDDYSGCAHLLEHMIIKMKQREFDEICNEGILFNAVTNEYVTEFTFINFRPKKYLEKNRQSIEKIFENIHISRSTEKLLSTEKKIILEEFSILENRYPISVVEKMLGDKTRIGKFNVKDMYDKYCIHYNKHKSMLLIDQNRINDEFYRISKSLQFNVSNIIIISKINNRLQIKRNIEAKIILFCLHICNIAQLNKTWQIVITESQEDIYIEILGKLYIGNKYHILNRYWLICTNIKTYISEISYLINNDLLELDIRKAFMENWEGNLYE